MRIVTRPDFDGIVCATLIYESENIDEPILWIEPSKIHNGASQIKQNDIMANLPYDKRCFKWFDHHISNEINIKFNGAFKVAPSAAQVVYEYYKIKKKLKKNFNELIKETNIIDAANLTKDMVLYPEKYPYILLSMTIKNRDKHDPPYWNKLVSFLRKKNISSIMNDFEVQKKCKTVIKENKAFIDILKQNTKIYGNISVTDFRNIKNKPSGNRFLTYLVFPESIASIKIRYDYKNNNIVLLSIGSNIFNKGLKVNIGKLLSKYGGGGHAGAGGCSINAETADKKINEIIKIMN